MKISFVVPVYNEEKELNQFYNMVLPVINGLNTEYLQFWQKQTNTI